MPQLITTLRLLIKALAPKLLAILLILIGFMPVPLTGISFFVPLFDIMIIYYWSIYDPKLFPQWFIVVMGCLQDILCGLPLGVTALSNLVFREIIVMRRRFFIKEPFLLIWLSFTLLSLLIVCLKWIVAALVFKKIFPMEAALMQWLLTVSLYACMHWLFNKLYTLWPATVSYAK
jgi:rod shape-determining protein MreD